MPARMIKETICTSDNLDKLSAFQETFFYRLLVNCDDYGCMDARPKILASKLFPLKDLRMSQIEDALRALTSAELVTLYEVNGKPFLQMNTWNQHQRVRPESKHKYPTPAEADKPAETSPPQSAANRGENPRDAETRGLNSYSHSINNSISDARARADKTGDTDGRFEKFWSAYPRKVGKGAAEKSFKSINPDDELLDRMIRAVEEAKQKNDQWRRDGGRFIPNPATWLNQKRWEDEPLPTAPTNPPDDDGYEDWGYL